MFLRKSLNSLQLIYNRQKCLNWCQTVANRRYLSRDSDGSDDEIDKSVEKSDKTSEPKESITSEDKVLNAKINLNQLIDNLKSKTIFGESDPRLRDILAKPQRHIRISARKEAPLVTPEEDINEISSEIDKRLILAAKGIASTLSGEESKRTESDLLKLLKLQVVETNLAKEGKTLSKGHLASILGDMKVVKEDPKEDNTFLDFKLKGPVIRDMRRGPAFRDQEIAADFESRDQKRRTLSQMTSDERTMGQSVTQKLFENRRHQRGSDQIIDKINLFTGEGIGIFDKNMKESKDSPKMYIWDRLEADELQYVIAQPPKNAFEEMIQWTEEGKLWKYPINNEQGLEEEEKVPFYEHVLLDHLLEGFPESGPIRKFMELVILGLASNPYITVERKHATVAYYRQYFAEKEDLLKMAGAL